MLKQFQDKRENQGTSWKLEHFVSLNGSHSSQCVTDSLTSALEWQNIYVQRVTNQCEGIYGCASYMAIENQQPWKLHNGSQLLLLKSPTLPSSPPTSHRLVPFKCCNALLMDGGSCVHRYKISLTQEQESPHSWVPGCVKYLGTTIKLSLILFCRRT